MYRRESGPPREALDASGALRHFLEEDAYSNPD